MKNRKHTWTGKILSEATPPYFIIAFAGTTLNILVCCPTICVKSKTSPLIDVYTLFGSLLKLCDANSLVLNTCSVGQISGPMIAIMNTADPHMSQMIKLSANFSRQACRTSRRFIRPRYKSAKFGTHHVSIQQSATQRRRAEDSLRTSAVSPSWMSPGRTSLSMSAFLSDCWNIFREGAYDSVPKFETDPSSRWLVSALRASYSSSRKDFGSS